MNILLIGNVGTQSANGQLVKTQDTIKCLKKIGYDVDVFDYGSQNKLFVIPKLYFAIKKHTNIIFMPVGTRALNLICNLFKKFKGKNIHYLTVGGRILDLLKNNEIPKTFNYLKTINGIYLQSQTAVEYFQKQGFTNAYYVSTFSLKDRVDKSEIEKRYEVTNCEVIKFVFFARVTETKGIYNACDVINELVKEGYKVSLDVYGPFESDKDKKRLNKYLGNNIAYKGVIFGNQTSKTLSMYYAMVFPTFYKGEGTPHSVIESFFAGLPIIASDWHFNSEIIMHNETGLIYSLKEKDSLKNAMLYCINHKEQMKEMSKKCLKESYNYSPEKVLEHLIKNL